VPEHLGAGEGLQEDPEAVPLLARADLPLRVPCRRWAASVSRAFCPGSRALKKAVRSRAVA